MTLQPCSILRSINRTLILHINRKYGSFINRNEPEFEPKKSSWDQDLCSKVIDSLSIHYDFITEKEESTLFKEVEPFLKRLVYEKDHWDEAIVSFRETERKHWNQLNTATIMRLREVSFKPEHKQLPYVHVLDLNEDGHIKPHIDSSRVSEFLIL